MKNLKRIAVSSLMLSLLAISVAAGCASTIGSGSNACGLVDQSSGYCYYLCGDGSYSRVKKGKAAEEELAMDEMAF